MQTRRLTILGILVAAALIVAPAADAATTFPVVSTADTADANAGDGLCRTAANVCTLRAAIQQANATASGAPYTISLAAISGQTITVLTQLPTITRDFTFIDGCGVGRELDVDMNPTGPPKEPASPPCVGVRNGSAVQSGLSVSSADRVYIQGLALTNFTRAIRLLGADNSRIRGNWFGLQRDGVTQESNGVAVQIIGRSESATDPATGNFVGGESGATDSSFPTCDRSCNTIVGSSVTGIDLAGGPGDPPAGAPDGEKTFIQGNWIGVMHADGLSAAPNAVGISIGGAHGTQIGGDALSGGEGNVIAGNTSGGVDQGTGTQHVELLHGVFGVSPDGDRTVGNGPWNARLRGSSQLGADVDKVVFGPADVGLDLEGPKALVIGSSFYSPDSARFKDAAIRIGPDGDNSSIGSAADRLTSPGCVPLINQCNQITGTATGVPGIWIDGADDARIQRNAIGSAVGFFPTPIDGPAIRFSGGAVGGLVGDDDDIPEQRNVLTRTAYPAIDIRDAASKVVVGDNEGLAYNALTSPFALFTDLVPDLGPGSPGPGSPGAANGGIRPPVITQATVDGIGGTATPGATIRILQQQRKQVTGDPPFPYEGYVFPTTPSSVTADDNGIWGLTFPTGSQPKPDQGLMAAQTTADGSSEYAGPQPATEASPPLVVTFTSGPSGVIGERTASFSFTASRVVRRFECSVDAGAFVPCSSPFTLNGLDIGGHLLQVRGVDPTGVAGNRASRTWIVLLPEAPAAGPPVSAAGAVRFASFVSLPSAKSCISKRSMRITVRTPKGSKVRGVVIRIAGRKVGSAKGAKTIPISLKGLKRGSFVVRVQVTLSDGRVIKGSRTYRTCAKKAAKKKKSRR